MNGQQKNLAKLCQEMKEKENEYSCCLECTKCHNCGSRDEGYGDGYLSGKILGRNLAFLEIKDFLVNSALLSPTEVIQQIKEKVK